MESRLVSRQIFKRLPACELACLRALLALSRTNRLTTKKDIDYIFKNGRTVRGSFLFIRVLKNQKEYSRFAFVIPIKYVPLAVDRNRIKRALSEEIRKLILLEHGYDMIVVIHGKVERNQLREVVGELVNILSKM